MNIILLLKAFPNSKIVDYLEFYEPAQEHADLDTTPREALFWANLGHETMGFKRFVENLNYTAAGLARTWPRLFADGLKPNKLAYMTAKKQENTANYAYSNRMGNGDFASGDGWKYRGRGPIQITGKANYELVDKSLGLGGKLVKNPDLLLEPKLGILSAADFWKRNNLNTFADEDDVDGARRKINGGMNGLEQVRHLYLEFSKKKVI